MKKNFILFFISFFSSPVFSQFNDLEKNVLLIDSLTQTKNYLKLIDVYTKISKEVNVKSAYYYKIYNCYVNINDTANAKLYIKMTLSKSPEYVKLLSKDNFYLKMNELAKKEINEVYLISLKQHHRKNKSDTVSSILKGLSSKDQFYRKQISQYTYLSNGNYNLFKFKFDSLMKMQHKLDSLNLLSLDSLINIYGWPDLTIVDSEDMHSAFYIAQHCNDVKKRMKYLKLIKKSTFEDNGSYRDYATYVDRTLFFKKKKQLYGTEQTIKDDNGPKMHPISNIKKLNNRRIKFGFGIIKIN
ncbi:MAG: DUF6624 domain-containing protein [Bacteroidota bacterium]